MEHNNARRQFWHADDDDDDDDDDNDDDDDDNDADDDSWRWHLYTYKLSSWKKGKRKVLFYLEKNYFKLKTSDCFVLSELRQIYFGSNHYWSRREWTHAHNRCLQIELMVTSSSINMF